MNRIQLLQDNVIDKISAGEVVERPASVVKELVENALDAGATSITVDLKDGGLQGISIIDNGFGMSRDDALLSLKRHATSKIRSEEDLSSIGTMGFRGEALASISAVSRLTLTTMDAEAGTRLVCTASEVTSCDPWTGPRGTTIAIEDLFLNVPARSKFLSSAATELAHCVELLQAIALSRPYFSLRLIANGKEKLYASPAEQTANASKLWGESAIRHRARAILGADTANQLLYVQDSDAFGSFEALASAPGMEKATGRNIYTFVNDRWVKDKTLRYGILRGYHSHLLKGRFPVVIGFLRCDPALIDVNVHPAKTELRFQYAGSVQGLIAGAIRKGLRQAAWAEAVEPEPVVAPVEKSAPVTQAPTRFSTPNPSSASVRDTAPMRPFMPPRAISQPPASATLFPPRTVQAMPQTPGQTIPWHDLNFVGSFQRCYLMFEWTTQLLVIDQHAFHERIVFERLRKMPELGLARQKLLVPEAVELAPIEIARLQALMPVLREHSFDLAFPGGDTVEVRAIPALLTGRDLQATIGAFARGSDRQAIEAQVQAGKDAILATIACHSAVRAGEELTGDDLRLLLREAQEVDFFHNCPHGRRVLRWFPKREVESWFDRS